MLLWEETTHSHCRWLAWTYEEDNMVKDGASTAQASGRCYCCKGNETRCMNGWASNCGSSALAYEDDTTTTTILPRQQIGL